MENKLQELTNKLYEEGLAKGRSDAERLVADAQAKADAIVREAEEKAAAVVEEARRKAEELRRNTMTEVTLAGRQAVGALKEHISEMIIAKTLSGPVHEAAVDPAFVREMLLAVAAGWRAGLGFGVKGDALGASSGRVAGAVRQGVRGRGQEPAGAGGGGRLFRQCPQRIPDRRKKRRILYQLFRSRFRGAAV